MFPTPCPCGGTGRLLLPGGVRAACGCGPVWPLDRHPPARRFAVRHDRASSGVCLVDVDLLSALVRAEAA